MKIFTKACVSAISLFATALILASCANVPGLTGTDSEPEYFPNRTGTSWIYEYPYTSDETPPFTKTTEVVGLKTILNGMKVSVLESTYRSESDTWADTQFVYADKDSVVVFKQKLRSENFIREHKFLLPLRVGDKVRWSRTIRVQSEDSNFTIDGEPATGEVLSQGSMIIGSKQYDNVFMVHNIDGADWSSSIETTFWIVPEIGIVKRLDFSCSVSPYTGREGGGVKNCYPYDRWEITDYQAK